MGQVDVPAGTTSGAASAIANDGKSSTATTDGKTGAAAATGGGWAETFSPELKEYIANKGFKDPSMLLDSYINLEKLRGVPQERLLKLPEAADSPEWGQVWSKLGRPDSPEGYGIEVPEKADPEFYNWAKSAFHKLNFTKDQATNLLTEFSQYSEGVKLTAQEKYKQQVSEQELALKKEWGAAYHQNIAVAQEAVKKFGVPAEAVDALEKTLGFDGVMKFLSNIGSKLGESRFIAGNQGAGFSPENGGILTPDQAKARISSLKKDPTFVQRYVAGDYEAKKKMDLLHEMAYPGSVS